nr:immunoglobulin light chain junction region [Macaca mulatta]MOW72236.1 immunoglobulin light chain junction region [Macaca mulatta]
DYYCQVWVSNSDYIF